MSEKCVVTEIYEMDFGCEGRTAETGDLVYVQLLSENGEVRTMQVSDAGLYEQEIQEGSEVLLKDGKLTKWR